MEDRFFTGTVSNVPNSFGFIDIASVMQGNGSAHGIYTKADIFVPQNECETPLRVGMVLCFQVRPDSKRGDGHFSAVQVTEMTGTDLVPATGSVMPGFHWSLAPTGETGMVLRGDGEPHPHDRMKEVPAEAVKKAGENKPLEGIPRDEDEIVLPDDPEAMRTMLERYLYTQYPSLQAVDMDYRFIGYDADALDTLIAETATGYREMEMEDQALLLEAEYAAFVQTRRFLAWIWEKDLLKPGTKLSPAVLTSLVKLVEQGENGRHKKAAVTAMQDTTAFMVEHSLLKPSTVIPVEKLPDLFMAVPVWFHAVEGPGSSDGNADGLWNEEDPQVHTSTRYFCDLIPESWRWSDVFQVFNRRMRTLKRYKGDMIPQHIMRVIRAAKEVFDYVVIMTPYHDVAGRDWEDIEWRRSIDPYVVGFKKELGVFFILGRFSDTGVFPLFEELVADTTEFLRVNGNKLSGFNAIDNPYWHTDAHRSDIWPQGRNDSALLVPKVDGEAKLGDHLIALVGELLQAFDAGHLFDWLRMDWSLPKQLDNGSAVALLEEGSSGE